MSSHIMTYSGVAFDPLRPSPSKVRIVDIAHALANQCRFSGHTQKFYSVAQHSLMVCALMPDGCGPAGQMLALLHDASEAYMVDMPTSLKQHPSFANFRAYEERVQGVIESRLILEEGITPDELDELRSSVKAADTVALVVEAKALLKLDLTSTLPPDYEIPAELKIDAWPSPVAKHRFLDHYFATVDKVLAK